MPSIPANWKSIRVVDLPIRTSCPSILRIQKVGHSPKIFAVWLPDLDDDPREHQGRSKGGTGKRLPIKKSTGIDDDAVAAGKRAIRIYKDWESQSKQRLIEVKEQKEVSLHKFWDIWFQRECSSRAGRKNFNNWRSNELLKWNGNGYGIAHQPWAKKHVEEITPRDMHDYWAVLDQRRTPKNDMAGTKKQQKTLINKLMREARSDVPSLGLPDFPPISTQRSQVQHLTRDQWDKLLETIISLSGNQVRFIDKPKSYQQLEFNQFNRINQRNWVDLWDALHLQWFYFLRALDMPVIRGEWFTIHAKKPEPQVSCFLLDTKGNREKHDTFSYRPDHFEFMTTLLARRPKGCLVLPHMNRPQGNESKHLLKTLNMLLKHAAKQTNKTRQTNIPEDLVWTTIRHTAFRLTLEEMPELGTQINIHAFAANGHTSPEMLQQTYLNFIRLEETAVEAMQKIPPSELTKFKLGTASRAEKAALIRDFEQKVGVGLVDGIGEEERAYELYEPHIVKAAEQLQRSKEGVKRHSQKLESRKKAKKSNSKN